MIKYTLPSILFLLLHCNYIPVTMKGTTITGRDAKSEIKKETKKNLLIYLSGTGAGFTASSSVRRIKQCSGYTTDTTNPSFKLPEPTDYTNVNLSSTITGISSGTVTHDWVSETINTVSYINVTLTDTPTCKYRLNAAPTSTIGSTLENAGTIAVETVPAVLYISCTTSFNSTQRYNYTISLNPRPRNLASNQPYSDQAQTLNLITEQTTPFLAGIKDDTVYTYESFERCKANNLSTVLAYSAALPAAVTSYVECGIYNPPPAQYLVQGVGCKLDEAKFIEN